MANQAALAIRDVDVEMCARPWIVEPSKNSRIIAVTMITQTPENVKMYDLDYLHSL